LLFEPPKVVPGPAVVLWYVTPTNAASQINRLDAEFLEV